MNTKKKFDLLGNLASAFALASVLIGGNCARAGVNTTVDPGRPGVTHFATAVTLRGRTIDSVQITFEDMKFLKVTDTYLYFSMDNFGSPPGGGNSVSMRSWGFLDEAGRPIYTQTEGGVIATEVHSLGTPVEGTYRVYGFFATWDPRVFVRAGRAQVGFEFATDVTVGGPAIDIRPRNNRNIIHNSSNGKIWVAVLSDISAETPFDPISQIDASTARFGPARARPIEHKVRDINHDGLPELLLRFSIPETGIRCKTKHAKLVAKTFDGRRFGASDFVHVVDCKQPIKH